MIITPIAHIRSEFPQKFGIPRQPMLAANTIAEIVFEPIFTCEKAGLSTSTENSIG